MNNYEQLLKEIYDDLNIDMDLLRKYSERTDETLIVDSYKIIQNMPCSKDKFTLMELCSRFAKSIEIYYE